MRDLQQDLELTLTNQAEDEVDSVAATVEAEAGSVVVTEEDEVVSAVIEEVEGAVEVASLREVATEDEEVDEVLPVVAVALPEVVEVVLVDVEVLAVKVPVPLRLNPTSTLVFSLPR